MTVVEAGKGDELIITEGEVRAPAAGEPSGEVDGISVKKAPQASAAPAPGSPAPAGEGDKAPSSPEPEASAAPAPGSPAPAGEGDKAPSSPEPQTSAAPAPGSPAPAGEVDGISVKKAPEASAAPAPGSPAPAGEGEAAAGKGADVKIVGGDVTTTTKSEEAVKGVTVTSAEKPVDASPAPSTAKGAAAAGVESVTEEIVVERAGELDEMTEGELLLFGGSIGAPDFQPVCPPGYFEKFMDGSCMKCDPHCLKVPDKDHCEDGIGCSKCDAGFFRAREDVFWPFECHNCEDMFPGCKKCVDGVYLNRAKCLEY